MGISGSIPHLFLGCVHVVDDVLSEATIEEYRLLADHSKAPP